METIDTIIEPSEFTNFLDSGAILRLEPNKWFLLMGPFVATEDISVDQVALYHPDFFMSSGQKYWLPKAIYELPDEQLKKLCQISKAASALPAMHWHAAELQGFQASISAILQEIQKGVLKKAVPIVFERSNEVPGPARIAALLENLIGAPKEVYVYGFWQDGQGVLGATPEILLQKKGATLKTMALAGTAPKEDPRALIFLEDAKERHEHQLVVQDICETLQSFGSIHRRGPSILELPTLLHLKTDIECQLGLDSPFSFFEACQKLHPTPALGVSPRSFDFRWMKALPEQQTRGGFGAPWGLQLSPTEAICLVAIRNLQWDLTGARIGAGCGVVAQSQLRREWDELLVKRQSVKKILGL